MPGGFDSSFDAPSLHLTNMTPQEARSVSCLFDRPSMWLRIPTDARQTPTEQQEPQQDRLSRRTCPSRQIPLRLRPRWKSQQTSSDAVWRKTAVSYLIDPSVPVQVHWTQLTCSVPQDIRDMADEPSQYLQLPDAYRPEMLAMLDLQCRNFLQ